MQFLQLEIPEGPGKYGIINDNAPEQDSMVVDEIDMFEDPYEKKLEDQASKRQAKIRRHFERPA